MQFSTADVRSKFLIGAFRTTALVTIKAGRSAVTRYATERNRLRCGADTDTLDAAIPRRWTFTLRLTTDQSHQRQNVVS